MIPILELAYSRDALLIDLMSKSRTWYDHMMKIFFYHDVPDAEVNKWKREVFSCYPRMFKYKHNKKYPKASEIYHAIFGSLEEDGITKEDIQIEMDFLEGGYTYSFCHDIDEWESAVKFLHLYCEWLSEELSKGVKITPSDSFYNIERCYQESIK